MQDEYRVKRKKNQFKPINLRIVWDTHDADGQPTEKTENFECVPFLTGQRVLQLGDMLSRDGFRGLAVIQILEAAISENARRRWQKFIEDEDAPDAEELAVFADDLLVEYSNRSQTKRPTPGRAALAPVASES